MTDSRFTDSSGFEPIPSEIDQALEIEPSYVTQLDQGDTRAGETR
ncbi:hypothetical protein [Microbacterium rhizomatis]|nr:hypothetical protein [Microbacterium rhizomatis]